MLPEPFGQAFLPTIDFKMLKEENSKKFMPVKDFALKYNITVQAVYERINAGTVEVKKIGSYTLVKQK